MSGTPTDPRFFPGQAISARVLQHLADLASRTERMSVAGNGYGEVGSGGVSFADVPPAEFWIRIVGIASIGPLWKYNWVQVQRTVDGLDWEFVPNGPYGTYDRNPAIEVNKNTSVPASAETGPVVKAWLAEDGESLLFNYEASGTAGDTTFTGTTTFNGTTTYNGPTYYPPAPPTSLSTGPATLTLPAGSFLFVSGAPPSGDVFSVIAGIEAPPNDGFRLVIVNGGDQIIPLINESTDAAAITRLRLMYDTKADVELLRPNFAVELQYDMAIQRWRVWWVSDLLCKGTSTPATNFDGTALDDYAHDSANPIEVWTLDANTSLRGLKFGRRGYLKWIINSYNSGPFTLVVEHGATTSAVKNRIITPTGQDFRVVRGGGVLLACDGDFWRVIATRETVGPSQVAFGDANGNVTSNAGFTYDGINATIVAIGADRYVTTDPADGHLRGTDYIPLGDVELGTTQIGYGDLFDRMTGSDDLIRFAEGCVRQGRVSDTDYPEHHLTRTRVTGSFSAGQIVAIWTGRAVISGIEKDIAYVMARYEGTGSQHDGSLELYGCTAGVGHLGLTVLKNGDAIVENARTLDRLLGTDSADGHVRTISLDPTLTLDTTTWTLGLTTGAAAPVNAEYVLLAGTASLTNYRTLSPANGIAINDNGALNSVTIGLTTTGVTAGTYSTVTVDIYGRVSAGTTTLTVGLGGTGRTTLTNHAVLVGAGTAGVTQLTVSTDGQLLIGHTGADPAFTTITGDVTITSAGVTAIGNGKVTFAMFATGVVDTDGALAANSDTKIPSQKAVKTYCDNLIAANDAMVYKGAINCSTNPNYPAADAGHTYKVSVAGKIGGASGVNVEVGDTLICTVDGTAAGNQAAVGANWNIVQANLDGAVIGPNAATDGNFALWDGSTGKLIKDSAYSPASFQPIDSDLTVIAALNSTGFARQAGAGVWSIVGETGTGSVVRSNSPALTTPDLGTPSNGVLASCTGLPIDGGTTGTLPVNRGGTAQTTALAARGSGGLNIESGTGHGDSAYTIVASDRFVYTNAAFTASRTWTLPAANAVNAGGTIIVADLQGTVTATNTLVISRAGADTINGGTNVTINEARGVCILVSDGTSKWQARLLQGTNSGVNTGDQNITLTGDVTGTGNGSFATAIGGHKVTRAMLAQAAAWKILGNNTAATADVTDFFPDGRSLAKVGASGYRSAASANLFASISTYYTIPLDTEDWDSGTILDSITNKGRFTVPYAGKYLLMGQLGIQSLTVGASIFARWLLNGATTLVEWGYFMTSAGAGYIPIAKEVSLAANDYVELQGLQTSGTNKSPVLGAAYSWAQVTLTEVN